MRVAAITGGRNVPSARFRIRQLIPSLRQHGIDLHESVPLLSRYPPERKILRPLWGLSAVAERLFYIPQTYRFELTLIQREMISTLATLEGLTKRPRVFDVDDSIHLYRNGRSAARLARWSEAVICGNEFLAERYREWNRNVVVIPTAVDTDRYRPASPPGDQEEKAVIGWIGSSSNFPYLHLIEEPLEKTLKKLPHAMLRVVADKPPGFQGLLRQRMEFIPWSPESEIAGIQGMSVGIMPLFNDDWGRGKCSYKMLQYMACVIPVVVSPVGMNATVLGQGEVGFGANTALEWHEGLMQILDSHGLRRALGENGRRLVGNLYSLPVISGQIAACLRKVHGRG